jgi:uncharacterized membrane protein YphA (DoxX/SURF4 family)
MRVLSVVLRVLAGMVFVFSGFVKGVDPWGSAIKLQDYFTAFGWDFLLPFSYFLGSLLNVAEFVIGFCLMFGIRVKLASLGALIFMLIFTPLTLYLAIANPVSDCGCFGDAIKMTNWETFYKNLIIFSFVLFVFIRRKKYRPWMNWKAEWAGTFIGLAIITGTTWYCYSYLPLMDFLPYKEGNHIPSLMTVPEGMPADQYEQFITLQDTAIGKNIDVTVDAYSNDSTYWGEGTIYKYISISEPRLVKKGYQPPIHDFTIVSVEDGSDITEEVLQDSSYTFMMISFKLSKAAPCHLDEINELAKFIRSKGYRFICMTSSPKEEIDLFISENSPDYSFYYTDETTLKSIIRSNPGIVLIKGGTVIRKWSHNALPKPEKLEKKYLK